MRKLALVLVCMACEGHGRRAKTSVETRPESTLLPSKAFALSLLASDPRAAFNPSVVVGSARWREAGQRFPVKSPSGVGRRPFQALLAQHAGRVASANIRCQAAEGEKKEEKSEEQQMKLQMLQEPEAAVVDLVERASDPFRFIRGFVYVTFGVSGLGGVVISAMQMGKDKNALTNLAVNLAVLAAGVGVFLFDRSVTEKLREKTKDELKNPLLKGDALMDDEEPDDGAETKSQTKPPA